MLFLLSVTLVEKKKRIKQEKPRHMVMEQHLFLSVKLE